MSAVVARQNGWQMLRHMVACQGMAALAIWATFVALVAAVTLLTAAVGEVGASMWEGATQLPRLYAAGMGVYMTALYLPLYIAHGETRRNFIVQSAVFTVVFAVALAALVTIGFVLEAGFYRVAGWPQEVQRYGLFTAPLELQRIFAASWVVYLGWTAAGAFVGAVYYRYQFSLYGLPLYPLALVPTALAEAAVGSEVGPVGGLVVGMVAVSGLSGGEGLPLLGALAAGAAAFALALFAIWALVRDIPIRNKAA